MAQLPAKTGAGGVIDSNTTVAQQETNFGNWLQFLVDLFGAGFDSSTAKATVIDNLLAMGGTISAATTTNLASLPNSRIIDLQAASAVVSITSFGTLPLNAERLLRVQYSGTGSQITLVHSSALACPGAQNLILNHNDMLVMVSLGSGNWYARNVLRAWSPDAGLQSGNRNRLINGDMRIDQRNNGASVTPLSGVTYLVDRWAANVAQSSKLTFGRNLNSIAPPAGFSNYLGIQTAAFYTPGASEQFVLQQAVEGVNIQDLLWGTAAALPATISFVARSSMTGVFGAVLKNGSGTRSYAFTFTVNAANTWEPKTVVVPGDTGGTWATDTTAGMVLCIDLGSGSSLRPSAPSWYSANYYGASGANNLIGGAGNTLYLTGAQLEAGGVATPFERREYGQELVRCMRYYEQCPSAVSLGFPSPGTGGYAHVFSWNWKVRKRAVPTVGTSVASAVNLSSTSVSSANEECLALQAVATAAGNVSFLITPTASAEL
jgi:hypothetical protein